MLRRIWKLTSRRSDEERFREVSPTLAYQPVTLRRRSVIRRRRRILAYLLGGIVASLGYGLGANSARSAWLRRLADRLRTPDEKGHLLLAGHTNVHGNHPHRDSNPRGYLQHLDTAHSDGHTNVATREEPEEPVTPPE